MAGELILGGLGAKGAIISLGGRLRVFFSVGKVMVGVERMIGGLAALLQGLDIFYALSAGGRRGMQP